MFLACSLKKGYHFIERNIKENVSLYLFHTFSNWTKSSLTSFNFFRQFSTMICEGNFNNKKKDLSIKSYCKCL